MTKLTTIALALACALTAGSASAQMLMANLNGANEKPAAGDPKGTGTAMVTLDAAKGQVCYKITTKDLADAKMAHIHKAPATAAGPVAVPLKPPVDGKVEDCATADAAVIKAIAANPGDYYVNVHTGAFPAGAIRGQLGK
jgi:hypothetical protein